MYLPSFLALPVTPVIPMIVDAMCSKGLHFTYNCIKDAQIYLKPQEFIYNK